MVKFNWPGPPHWKGWQKFLFRFLFAYFLLNIAPWTWIGFIPGGDVLLQPWYEISDWMVQAANHYIFHGWPELVPVNGSGDTSWAWTQFWLYLCVAGAGAIIWSLFSRRKTYNGLAYFFRQMLRYTVAMNCFGYGIIKIFGLQMYYPNLSQLATPLGDFLPMRLSWMFMGYSFSYQAFSGVMEVLAGLLLCFRRTTPFGLMLAAGVFMNVMMLNLSFDIPVKLFSTHLVVMCLILLAFDYRRLLAFAGGGALEAARLYEFRFPIRWMRIIRWILKAVFALLVILLPLRESYLRYQQEHLAPEEGPVPRGIYEVKTFVLNGDTLSASLADDQRWKDVIFDYRNSGSIGSTDTIFRQRYHRGYFSYRADSSGNHLVFSRSTVTGESIQLFELGFRQIDSLRLHLYGRIRRDSVSVMLQRLPRHFQLTENQFHWLSEYNR